MYIDAWEAFLGAHTNMNKIQASMALVPRQVKTALQVLASPKSTPRIISMLLPSTLQEIERLGKTCVILANTTHVSFVTVMNLLGEVISMTETSRGLQETRLRQTEIELNVSKVMQEELAKLGETIRSHYNEVRETVRKAQDEYSRALRKIPTGFESLLYDLGRAVISVAKTAAEILITDALGSQGAVPGLMAGSAGQSRGSLSSGQSLAFGKLFSDSLNKALPRIKDILEFGRNNDSTAKNPTEELEAYKVTFEAFLSSLTSGKESSLKNQAGQLIQRGIHLLQETTDKIKIALSTGESVPETVAKDIENRFEELAVDVKPMAAAEVMNGANVPPAPADGSTAMGDSSQNEKFAAQLALNRVQSAESRYDKIFDQLKQNQEELAKLMGKIASLDMQRINYKEILELLREALFLLARIREQWGHLVLFFAQVATHAEITLSGTLGPFITEAGQAGTEGLSLDERLFFVDLLKAQAGEIDSQSQMLYLMSRTYVDMSTKYIMTRLAGLSKMLVARDDAERNRLLAELSQETQSTQQGVMNLVTERKTNYQITIRKRRVELENFINKLGGPDADDLAAIEAGKQLLDNQF